jgi:hypothetical protein
MFIRHFVIRPLVIRHFVLRRSVIRRFFIRRFVSQSSVLFHAYDLMGNNC